MERRRVLLLSVAALLVGSCTSTVATAPKMAGAAQGGPVVARAPQDRQAYFGELHLHTTMSFDAWTFGTKVTPDMAYRFARGETVMVPALQAAKEQGLKGDADVPARRGWPLDFAAVTDHSEYLGAVAQLDNPTSTFALSDFGKLLSAGGRMAFFRAAAAIVLGTDDPGTPDLKAAADAADGWNVEKRAANANYQPGKFTTLLAYEWSASPSQGIHMHRNVIFAGDDAPAPFTARDSNRPEDLWAYMNGVRAKGGDVLAIPHNSNFSDGRDFDWMMSDGKPMSLAYAIQRSLNEPLVEIAQNKGTSETAPDLSPNDEFANFEIMDHIYAGETEAKHNGSYVRQALGRGLVVQSRVSANPLKLGFVGASDIHNGLSTSEERAFAGDGHGIDPATMIPSVEVASGNLDMTGRSQIIRPNGQKENDPLHVGSGAITGVWAEENTRPAIFAALKRRETFATSGTRIRVRMFGGWGFEPQFLTRPDWVKAAYGRGVPMGGELQGGGQAGRAPGFVIMALKDPSGANLDRIQVIKVWLEGKTYREQVFDVALSGGRTVSAKSGRAPPVGSTVKLSDGSYSNRIGAVQLATVWRDPQFDRTKPALYYARVLEVPTPRWSTLLALRNHLPIPSRVPATLQERAWTSPIWYNPAVG